MRAWIRIGSGVLTAIVLILGAQQLASEWGEVVVLTTRDHNGKPLRTRLWVVDLEEQAWLRAGAARSTWFARLQANPRVALERHAVSGSFRAVPAVDMREQINELMSRKYGWADDYIGLMFDRKHSVPVRLEPDHRATKR